MYQSIFTWAGTVSDMRRFLGLAIKNHEDNEKDDRLRGFPLDVPIARASEAIGEAMFQERIK